MASSAKTVERLAEEPSGTRADALAVLAAAEKHRSWIAAREAVWARYADGLPKDPSSPAKDLAGELEREQKVSAGQAKKRAERAEQLGELPDTEDALEQGQITDAHADAMARTRAKADPEAKAALAEHEAELLAHAERETPGEFHKRLDRFVQQHSQDDGRDEWDKKKARQRLTLRRGDDGMTTIGGLLAPEGGQITRRVLLAIADELYRRDHADHPSDEPVPWRELTNEQRLAEALVEACRRSEQFGGVAQNVDRAVVVMPYDDLVGCDGPTANTSTLRDGTPVPASVARRMACDAGTIPLVLGGASRQLDYGRARRLASPGQTQLLRTLWSTCSFADCTVPVAWTETHHTIPFNEDGSFGRTDIGELTPCCRGNCHDLAHTPGWQFSKDPDTHATTTIAPDGTRWERRPNGPAIKEPRPAEPPPAAAPQPVPDPEDQAATLFTTVA